MVARIYLQVSPLYSIEAMMDAESLFGKTLVFGHWGFFSVKKNGGETGGLRIVLFFSALLSFFSLFFCFFFGFGVFFLGAFQNFFDLCFYHWACFKEGGGTNEKGHPLTVSSFFAIIGNRWIFFSNEDGRSRRGDGMG